MSGDTSHEIDNGEPQTGVNKAKTNHAHTVYCHILGGGGGGK